MCTSTLGTVGDVTRGGKGSTIPRAPNHYGVPNHCGGAGKSRQCHKYFLQYIEFASERVQVRTWGRQTCSLIQAPSNLVMPLGTVIHWVSGHSLTSAWFELTFPISVNFYVPSCGNGCKTVDRSPRGVLWRASEKNKRTYTNLGGLTEKALLDKEGKQHCKQRIVLVPRHLRNAQRTQSGVAAVQSGCSFIICSGMLVLAGMTRCGE